MQTEDDDLYRVNPWLKARRKTRGYAQPTIVDTAKEFILSLPGTPARVKMKYAIVNELGYENAVVIPDLNKYRPGANLKAMKEEMGINHIILRMGGPTQFMVDHWNMTEDATWRGYFTDAAKLGYKSIGGYFIYSAGIDAQDYVNGHAIFDFIRECVSNGFVPDYIIADDEVNYWTENNRTVYSTPVNQVKGLQYLFPKIWDKWKKPVMHYTARWFVNQKNSTTGESYLPSYVTFLDNINRMYETQGVAGKQVLNWYAWYIAEYNGKTQVFDKAQTILDGIPIPTSNSINNYLSIGSNSLYDLHQFSSTVITPHVKNAVTGVNIGIDFSVSRQNETLFMQAINKVNVPTTPPPTIPPPTDEWKQSVEMRLAGLEEFEAEVRAL